jgi:uncharacterized surface protein with fasciclin (FAS1) repeats
LGINMQHMAIAAAFTALFIGAGAGAVTNVGPQQDPNTIGGVANPMVGGHAMLPSQDIFDNTARSPEHAVLVAEFKAAGLADTLRSKGPYTVFAPTDAAFEALPRGAETQLLQPGHRAAAAKSASYLVVKGRYDSQTLLKLINENGGEVKLTTLEGGPLLAMLNGPTNIALVDQKGAVADISIYDIYQSNGVIQVIDKVISPS